MSLLRDTSAGDLTDRKTLSKWPPYELCLYLSMLLCDTGAHSAIMRWHGHMLTQHSARPLNTDTWWLLRVCTSLIASRGGGGSSIFIQVCGVWIFYQPLFLGASATTSSFYELSCFAAHPCCQIYGREPPSNSLDCNILLTTSICHSLLNF